MQVSGCRRAMHTQGQAYAYMLSGQMNFKLNKLQLQSHKKCAVYLCKTPLSCMKRHHCTP